VFRDAPVADFVGCRALEEERLAKGVGEEHDRREVIVDEVPRRSEP
jgi:hypothetical protein